MRFTSSENTQLGIRFLGFSVDIYVHACRHLVELISCSKCLSSSPFLAESVLAHGAVLNQRSHFSDGAAGSSAKHKLKFALKKKRRDDVDSTREYGLTSSCGPEASTLRSADWRDGGDSSQGQKWFSGITELLHVRCSQEGLWDHRRGNCVCVSTSSNVKVTQITYTVGGMNANSLQMRWNSSDSDTTSERGSTTSVSSNRVLMSVREQTLQRWQCAGVHHLPASDFISPTHLSTRCAWHNVPLTTRCHHRLNPVETVFGYSEDQN